MIIKHGRHIREVRKGMWDFFFLFFPLDYVFRVLIGWAATIRSRGRAASYFLRGLLDARVFATVNEC